MVSFIDNGSFFQNGQRLLATTPTAGSVGVGMGQPQSQPQQFITFQSPQQATPQQQPKQLDSRTGTGQAGGQIQTLSSGHPQMMMVNNVAAGGGGGGGQSLVQVSFI